MAKAYLGLGSNLGDKQEYIKQALDLLETHGQIEIKKTSSYYLTEPVGYQAQDWFLNTVVEIATNLEPLELLKYCQIIEQQLHRKRTIRWGPRTIDIDLLLYKDLSMKTEFLTIPHPRMTERAFVMFPLYEIAPDITIKNQDIKEIVKGLQEQKIEKL